MGNAITRSSRLTVTRQNNLARWFSADTREAAHSFSHHS